MTFSISDSIFATANLLHASGAPQNWHDALFAYNHAEWYVQEVLEAAERFGAAPVTCETGIGGEGLERVESVARWIESRRLHYCWGGGHGPKPGPSGGEYCWSASGEKVFGASEEGLDCSGAVRWLLVLSGFKDTGPIVSGDFASAYPERAGQAGHDLVQRGPCLRDHRRPRLGHLGNELRPRPWLRRTHPRRLRCQSSTGALGLTPRRLAWPDAYAADSSSTPS